jgi:hypothetical protein
MKTVISLQRAKRLSRAQKKSPKPPAIGETIPDLPTVDFNPIDLHDSLHSRGVVVYWLANAQVGWR